MKRVFTFLIALIFGVNVGLAQVQQTITVNISGTVFDTAGLTVPGITIKAFSKARQAYMDTVITDSVGSYFISYTTTDTIDTVLLYTTDFCGTVYQDTVIYTSITEATNLVKNIRINCGLQDLVITGRVVDSTSNPGANLKVYLALTDTTLSTTTDIDGNFTFTLPAPRTNTVLRVYTYGVCGDSSAIIINYTLGTFNYTANLTIACAVKPTIFINGNITNQNGDPLKDVMVKIYYKYSPNLYYMGFSDNNGYYSVDILAPNLGETIYIEAIDGCNNKALDSITFNYVSNTTYQKDFILSCNGNFTKVITFTGTVKRSDGTPAANMPVKAIYTNSYPAPSAASESLNPSFSTLTNEDGSYKLEIPVPYSPDTIVISVLDSCNTEYTNSIYFDYNNGVFNYNANFTVQCGSPLTQVEAKLAIAVDQDYDSINVFHFTIYLDEIYQSGDIFPQTIVWYIGMDTITTSLPELTYTFPDTNCYMVKVKVWLSNGQIMVSTPIRVCVKNPMEDLGDNCFVDLIPVEDTVSNLNMNFIPIVVGLNGFYPVGGQFDFGDGNVVTIDTSLLSGTITHNYTAGGRYDIELTVFFVNQNQETCEASIDMPIWVGSVRWYPDSCAALFYAEADTADPLTIHFQDMSYPGPMGKIVSYYWDFGDDDVSTASSPVHTYDSAQVYDVSLEIITTSGCIDEFEMSIDVGKEFTPVLFFPDTVAKSSRKGYGVVFYNLSKNRDGNWSWDFGEAGKKSLVRKATVDTVIHYYQDTGKYTVTLYDSLTNTSFSMQIHVTQNLQVVPITSSITTKAGTTYTQAISVQYLKIRPNPTRDNLYIALPDNFTNYKIEIYNIKGQIVKRIFGNYSGEITIDVSNLQAGIYLIKLYQDNVVYVGKFIKQ